MEIPSLLFEALVEGLREETSSLEASGLLKQSCRDHALSRVFQEHVLRYLALRHFYKRNPGEVVRFDTEKDGPIDLILEQGPARVAFEFKRWQTGKEKQEINGKDCKKLKAFTSNNGGRSGYAVVFTNTNNAECKKNEEQYQKDFEDHLKQYQLRRLQLIPLKDFTICEYLAELR